MLQDLVQLPNSYKEKAPGDTPVMTWRRSQFMMRFHMLLTIVLPLIGGLALLTWGADRLVNGASRLALFAGISPLVIGLTLVAMGTSAPELAISVLSSLKGEADLALGNIVGSNILNLLLVLGVSAVILPLSANKQVVRWDVPVMIAVTALSFYFAYTEEKISSTEGLILLGVLIPYLGSLYFWNKKSQNEGAEEELPDDVEISEEDLKAAKSGGGFWARIFSKEGLNDLGLVVLGIVCLSVGAKFFTDGAIELAQVLGVPEWIIGLTVVALGTSAPELATSIVASLKKETDLAIGNIVGSCIFNLLWVLGPAAFFATDGINVEMHALDFDFPFLLIITAAALPMLMVGLKMNRFEGCTYLLCYVYYASMLALQVLNPPLFESYSPFLWSIFLPVVILVLGLSAFLKLRGKSAS